MSAERKQLIYVHSPNVTEEDLFNTESFFANNDFPISALIGGCVSEVKTFYYDRVHDSDILDRRNLLPYRRRRLGVRLDRLSSGNIYLQLVFHGKVRIDIILRKNHRSVYFEWKHPP